MRTKSSPFCSPHAKEELEAAIEDHLVESLQQGIGIESLEKLVGRVDKALRLFSLYVVGRGTSNPQFEGIVLCECCFLFVFVIRGVSADNPRRAGWGIFSDTAFWPCIQGEQMKS